MSELYELEKEKRKEGNICCRKKHYAASTEYTKEFVQVAKWLYLSHFCPL